MDEYKDGLIGWRTDESVGPDQMCSLAEASINESYLYPPTYHHQFFDFCNNNDDRKPSLPMVFVKDCGSPNSVKSNINFDKSDTDSTARVPYSHFNMYECMCMCADVDTREHKHTHIQKYTDAHITHTHTYT